jgi:hypothetical protein
VVLRSYRLFTLEQGGAASCMRALLAAAERQNVSGRCAHEFVCCSILDAAGCLQQELTV